MLSSVVVCNSAFALSRDLFIYLFIYITGITVLHLTGLDLLGAGVRSPELAHRSTCQSALRCNVRSVLVWSCSNNTGIPGDMQYK